ncbi:Ldh family oxidoreductase [Albidovulum litorale]|uniref:Ldh family oxidoreductase n=1 Tax=Albidovulum litorale TaxID=2984134 RepID=UPI0021E743C0|nr:Ldh family oxidoreductase [Defluviimonas sp. WL0050]
MTLEMPKAEVTPTRSKLEFRGAHLSLPADDATARLAGIFRALGSTGHIAEEVAAHLVDANLCGVESHGVVRVLQYAGQFRSGYMRAGVEPIVKEGGAGRREVDGQGGIGIPAMQMAFDEGCRLARATGVAALAVRNVGHTGRHGAFAEAAANEGMLTFLMGGGNRQTWRQVAPHGGRKALLPTNPWCIGIPGGARGPVVLDFATSKIAGGWIYAAHSAGALLPEGCVIDRHGHPTRDPEDYFAGGAILPSGEHKGYGLALMAELIAEAMLGPVTAEANWLLIAIDATGYCDTFGMARTAEEILAELRDCPPAPGFVSVDIPGERERAHSATSGGRITVPEATWAQIGDLARSLGVAWENPKPPGSFPPMPEAPDNTKE